MSASEMSFSSRHPKDAGIVDEDVEPAELRDRLLDRSLNGGAVGAVGLDRDGLAPRALMARRLPPRGRPISRK